MSVLQVLHIPDERLRKVAKPVEEVNAEIQRIVDDMFETMYAEEGIGLAATQVDIHQRIIVIDVSENRDERLVLINPELLEKSGETGIEEGCLSIPEQRALVPRAEKVKIRALDRDGKPFELEADGGDVAADLHRDVGFTAGAGYGVVIERHANGGICGGDVRHRRAKCVVCAGAAVLQHADPRHRRGNRRRSRASGGDERSAAGRENVSARYRKGRGDGGFCAGHFAGRPGGIYSDEPQITDADPGQRCLSIHPVVGVGRFDSHFRVNAVSQLWCQSLDKTWQRRRYELAALFVSDY